MWIGTRTAEEHDGYRKALARPGIWRHDNLQKVRDYEKLQHYYQKLIPTITVEFVFAIQWNIYNAYIQPSRPSITIEASVSIVRMLLVARNLTPNSYSPSTLYRLMVSVFSYLSERDVDASTEFPLGLPLILRNARPLSTLLFQRTSKYRGVAHNYAFLPQGSLRTLRP